jgi:uncharacterized protein YecT (DUF1311 family)
MFIRVTLQTLILKAVATTFLLTSFIGSAVAASFDCKPYLASRTCPETVICATPELSASDERVAASYQNLLRKKSGAATEQLKSDQRTWLGSRNACGCDATCIAREYQRRSEYMVRPVAAQDTNLIRSTIWEGMSGDKSVELVIWNSAGGCDAEQCQALRFRCDSLVVPFLNDEEESRVFKGLSRAFLVPKGAGLKLSFSIGDAQFSQQIDDLHLELSDMNGYSVRVTSRRADPRIPDGQGIKDIIMRLAATSKSFNLSLFGVRLRGMHFSEEHRNNFQRLLATCEAPNK